MSMQAKKNRANIKISDRVYSAHELACVFEKL